MPLKNKYAQKAKEKLMYLSDKVKILDFSKGSVFSGSWVAL
jgi:hypothetical protein